MFEQKGATLTWFFKTGQVKAKGRSVDDVMQGRWIFYREDGQLWLIFDSSKDSF